MNFPIGDCIIKMDNSPTGQSIRGGNVGDKVSEKRLKLLQVTNVLPDKLLTRYLFTGQLFFRDTQFSITYFPDFPDFPPNFSYFTLNFRFVRNFPSELAYQSFHSFKFTYLYLVVFQLKGKEEHLQRNFCLGEKDEFKILVTEK